MKKIILIIILSIFTNEVYSQDLRKLSKSEREKEIRKICKATILKYGDSRYWEEDADEEIVFVISYKIDIPEYPLNNKSLYVVTYKTKEQLERIKKIRSNSILDENTKRLIDNIYISKVYILADTGEPARIIFGKFLRGLLLLHPKVRASRTIKKLSYDKPGFM